MEQKLKEKLLKFKGQNKNEKKAKEILDYFMLSFSEEFHDIDIKIFQFLNNSSIDLNDRIIDDKNIHKEMEKMLNKAIQMITEEEVRKLKRKR